jgi:hypothetical protein
MAVTIERRARALLCALAALSCTLAVGLSSSGRAGATAVSARIATATVEHASTNGLPALPIRVHGVHHNSVTVDGAAPERTATSAPTSTPARTDVSAGSHLTERDSARTRGPPGGSLG